MNGFCGFFSKENFKIDETKLCQSINLTDNLIVKTKRDKNFLLSTSFNKNSLYGEDGIHETNEYIYLFTGDLIYHSQIPWETIVFNFENGNYHWFSELRGTFAFAITNKSTKKIHLISDHFRQIPIYYGFLGDDFIFSTDLSTFFVAQIQPIFNVNWLYEYIFFGFPIDSTTFLKDIDQIRAKTVMVIDPNNKKIDFEQYEVFSESHEQSLTFDKTTKEAYDKFSKVVPNYFSKDQKNIIALSGGFDSRMLLSLAPKGAKVTCYTYGIKNCGDLLVAKNITKKLEIEHKEILFDEQFKKELPELIYDVVRLSGGTQPILRSTILYVYNKLYRENNEQSVPLIGGIGGDFFRGMSEHIRPMVTEGIVKYFKTGKIELNKSDYYSNVFDNNYNEFESHITKSLKKITELYGSPQNIKTALAYDLYEINRNYFGGEMSIANNYFHFRLPYLDYDLIKLGLRSPLSSEKFNAFRISSKKIGVKRYFIQANIMSKIKKVAFTYINGVPLFIYKIRNNTLFKMTKLLIRGWSKVIDILRNKPKQENLLEDWNSWFKNDLSNELDKLLNEKSLINEYVSYNYIMESREKNNYELLGKFATTEIILRLIKEKWQLK